MFFFGVFLVGIMDCAFGCWNKYLVIPRGAKHFHGAFYLVGGAGFGVSCFFWNRP